MKRKPPTKDEKLAAVLLEYQRLLGDPIDREQAKQMTAAEITSLFQWDHDVHVVNRQSDDPKVYNHPTIMTPRLILQHREKTAKKDIPQIAKGKRIRADNAQHTEKMAAKIGQAVPLGEIVDRVMLKTKQKIQKRKLQGRGFGGWRAMDGTPRWKRDRKRRASAKET